MPIDRYHLGPASSFWTTSEKEARFQYAEIFEHGCYADVVLPERAFVVGVGANIGLFSYFIRREFPSCQVLAFEPMPETCCALRRNVRAHGLTGVWIEECALGERSEKAEFMYYPLLPATRPATRTRRSCSVRSCPVSSRRRTCTGSSPAIRSSSPSSGCRRSCAGRSTC